MIKVSGHGSPWNVYRHHPARGTASPLLRAHVWLPMTMASGHSSPWNLYRHHPTRGTASPLLRAHFWLPMTMGSGHTPCPSHLHRCHPARGTASPLIRAHLWLPMTTVSGHSSPWNLYRHHPARGTALPLLRAPFRLPMTMVSGHTAGPSSLHQHHPAREAASPLFHAHSPPKLIEAIYHPRPSSLPWCHSSTGSRLSWPNQRKKIDAFQSSSLDDAKGIARSRHQRRRQPSRCLEENSMPRISLSPPAHGRDRRSA